MNKLFSALHSSFVLVLLMTLLLGGVYPLVVTGIAQSIFPAKSNGGLIERGNKILGAKLLGQSFESPKYFWGRLSATVPPYNATASTGSNMNPANPKLLEAANARIAALQKADPENKARIPVDLVTASASGLDPHISLAAAHYQAARVARARGMKEGEVKALIEKFKESSIVTLFSESYVNVVKINMALDEVAHESTKEKR